MAASRQMFRLFVSSTFGDLTAERDALQERVFPRLRELCRQRGVRFQAIDLRWGVSQEAALDQRTMMICLDEIERCRRVTPKPNFLVLLGERYGWRPLPPRIEAAEFRAILERTTPGHREQLVAWYRCDENAVPAAYVLQARTDAYADDATWAALEIELRAILLAAVHDLPLEAIDRQKYEASATHQEIERGAMRIGDADQNVHCFFRAIDGLPDDGRASAFVDQLSDGRPDLDARARLARLKALLRHRLPENVHEVRARWTTHGLSTDHLDDLCDTAYAQLAGAITAELDRRPADDEDDPETAAHTAFGVERARHFVGRDDTLAAIFNHLTSDATHPLVLVGGSGSGKSAVLARLAQLIPETLDDDASVVVRFVGATPATSDGRTLLEGLCRDLSRRYGRAELFEHTDFGELARELPRRLAYASYSQPAFVILDALDQLPADDPASDLSWLPDTVPSDARLIVSLVDDERVAELARRLPPAAFIRVPPLLVAEGDALLEAWLADARRTLQPRQRADVLDTFAKTGLPLHLKLAFEEARHWPSYAPDISLSVDVPGIVRDLFARLSANASHGSLLVERSLAYLAASRHGLSEDELLDLLSDDEEVVAEFKLRSPHSPVVARLPVVAWSRLHFDLEPYLANRAADGVALIGFYHRQLQQVVNDAYLSGDLGLARHRALARYFAGQPLVFPVDDQQPARPPARPPAANLRKLTELPYQQMRGELWDDLFATLTDFEFLQGKATHVGVFQRLDRRGAMVPVHEGVFHLQRDYALALAHWPGATLARKDPIIVTATDFGDGLRVRCAACGVPWPLQAAWLGTTILCPGDECRGQLRVNPFTVGAATPR